jgi:3-deoxy-7-phosphoheptulonate synthase
MILVLEKGTTKEGTERLKEILRSEGHMVKEIGGVEEQVLGVVGKNYKEGSYYESLPGVEKAVPISKPYKLVSREFHPAGSVIKVGDVAIGGDRLVVMAGPCGVEGRKTTMDIAREVRKHGAVLFRGAPSSRGPRPMLSRAWVRKV